jgi:hypothetical protein
VNRLQWLGVLILTHGLVGWAGVASREEESRATAQGATDRPARPRLPSRPDSEQERQLRDQRYAAAARTFGPRTDFVAAMTAGTATWKKRFSPETEACLVAWLEHDPVLAVRWLAVEPNQHHYQKLVLDHLERKGSTEWVRLLNEAADGAEPVLGVVPEWMKTHDFDELLAIAKQVTGKGVRADLIRRAFQQNPGTLIGKLPEIRAVLDDWGAVEFFWHTRDPSNELADAAAEAGFPDEAVRLLRKMANHAEEQQRSVADQLALPDRKSSKWAEATWAQATLEKLRQAQPELRDWVADFAERGLPADEVVARLREAEPSLQGHDDETRLLVFHSLFTADAVGATRWLKESQKDWKPLLQSAVEMRLPRAEELWRLSESLPEEDGKPMLLDRMGNAYWDWCSRDPEGFQKGFDALPPGARRDQLAATVVSLAGLRDRASALELVQRIGDPALRAEAEKRIKELP